MSQRRQAVPTWPTQVGGTSLSYGIGFKNGGASLRRAARRGAL